MSAVCATSRSRLPRQHREGCVEGVALVAAGIGVGDHQNALHVGRPYRLAGPLPLVRKSPGCCCVTHRGLFAHRPGRDGSDARDRAVGAQWGDEGKGKATDQLGDRVDYVVQVQRRQQRRAHRRHRRREVRPAPAAQRHPHARRRAGDRQRRRRRPRRCCSRRSTRSTARGVDTSRLVVSANAHVIAPYNRTLDKVTERFLGNRRIGTTGRGIGPTYADKMNRVGIRVQDLFDEKILRQKVEGALEQKNHLLVKVYNRRAIDGRRGRRGAARVRRPAAAAWSPTPRCCSTRRSTTARPCCSRAARRPCSTSTTARTRSSRRPTRRPAARAPAPASRRRRIDRVIAVVKAYTTRVGEGPFPTELLRRGRRAAARRPAASSARRPAARAGAAGTTPSIARYAARVNGVTDFVLTKLDVLTGWDRIPVCVAYDVDGARHRRDADDPDATSTTRGRSTSASTAGRRTSRLPRRSTTCRPTRRRYLRAPRSDVRAPVSAGRRRPGPRPEHRAPRPRLTLPHDPTLVSSHPTLISRHPTVVARDPTVVDAVSTTAPRFAR